MTLIQMLFVGIYENSLLDNKFLLWKGGNEFETLSGSEFRTDF